MRPIFAAGVLGIRRDGQKVCWRSGTWAARAKPLACRARRFDRAWPANAGIPADRWRCRPRTRAASLWPELPTQRCTVHKHRNLLAHAPEALHEEITADYHDMIYAETSAEVMRRRRLFLAKWRLKYRTVADSWKRPASACSPSPACIRANGNQRERRMR